MNREAMRKEQRLAGSQMRRNLVRVNLGHLRVWKRQENYVSALRRFECVQNFETAAPGADTRFATRIKPDNYLNPLVPEIECVCSTLCTEANHRACFSLQPTEIGIFVGVNARGQIFTRDDFRS
jgi:hypothetical protein